MSDAEDDEPGAKRQCTCPPCVDLLGPDREPVTRSCRFEHANQWAQRERDAGVRAGSGSDGEHDDGGFDGGDGGDGAGDDSSAAEEEEPENIDPEDIDNPDVLLERVEGFCRSVVSAVVMGKMPIKSCDQVLRAFRDSFGEYIPAWGRHMIPTSYRAAEALVADAVLTYARVCSTRTRVCSTCTTHLL
jgi:hypothetical protein